MLTLAGITTLAYLALCVALFVFQRSMLYFPQPRTSAGGEAPIVLRADGAQVLVSTRTRDGPDALLYFGGNAEDVSANVPALAALFPDHALYLMHYRGYGGSTGSPSEAALFADAEVLFDTVHALHPKVVVVGRSLGSGVAVHLASRRPVARLILVTPYDSMRDVAAHHYPWFPVRWLLRDRFESWKYAPAVTAPTLLIAAEHDEVIPRARTDALFSRFRDGVARMEVIPGTSHNTISGSPRYAALLAGPG